MDRMGEPFAKYHRVSVDWMLIAITGLAAILLIASTIRTDTDAPTTRTPASGGLPVLSSNQRLVAFEDFSFGANGWMRSGEAVETATGPVGAGLGEKTYALPIGTEWVEIAFDLHLPTDEAGEDLVISLNGVPVIEAMRAVQGAHVMRSPDGDGWSVSIRASATDAATLRIASDTGRDAEWVIDNVLVVAWGGPPTS